MDLHAIAFAGLAGALGACTARTLPPVAGPQDPTAHEIFLVAFADAGPGYIVLERFAENSVELIAYDPVERTRTPVAPAVVLPPPPGSDRAALARNLAASPLGKIVADLGYSFAEVLAAAPPALFDATITLAGDVVTVRSDDASAELLQLPSDAIESHRWLLSADRRRVGLEVQYTQNGGPRLRALHVFDIRKRVGALWSTAGYTAHIAGDYATARRLWLRALAADAQAAEVLYNLACADARLGAADAAMEYLRRALALEPEQLRRHARDDPDLESLRRRPDFHDLVGHIATSQPPRIDPHRAQD